MEGVKVEELFSHGRDEDTVVGGNGYGREIDEIPLCAQCVGEIGRERIDEEHLIPMALGRVDKFDGGLSRRRWEARQQQESPPTAAAPDSLFQQEREEIRRTPSPIYVSIHDPLGQPAFRRSPTKPIPKWMQYLPSQRDATRHCPAPRPVSILDEYLSVPEFGTTESDTEAQSPPSPPPVPPHTVPVRPNPRPTCSPVLRSRPFSVITEEPLQRPSSGKHGANSLPPGKHVRFTPGVLNSQSYVAFNDRGKTRSESSEFLERYHVHSHNANGSVKSSAVAVPPGHDERYVRAVSPFVRHGNATTGPLSEEGASQRFDVKNNNEVAPSSAQQRHPPHARSALELAARYGISRSQKDGEKDHASHYEYAHVQSPVNSLHVGADGMADRSGAAKRRPLTFQDQLKKVFGFA